MRSGPLLLRGLRRTLMTIGVLLSRSRYQSQLTRETMTHCCCRRSGRRPRPTASTNTESRETPLETLRRRYAKGEISTEEYKERKARLDRPQSPGARSGVGDRGRGCC